MRPNDSDWITVLGSNKSNLLLTYNLTTVDVPPTMFVQARFRCQNKIGFGSWSSSSYLLMAGVPTAPPKPTYISSTNTTITVQLYPTTKSNGAPVTEYEIWRNSGDHNSDLTI